VILLDALRLCLALATVYPSIPAELALAGEEGK